MTDRPGGPARLRATTTSVAWPTTSRPSRIQAFRASSRRTPVPSPTAAATGATSPGGSRTRRVIPARRARAASRPRRAANRAAPSGRAGRSTTRRSTVRPDRSAPAIASPSSGSAGVRTTSHGGWTPRATASTGSNAAARSSQATIPPPDCASAASRSARVVRPLERSPRSERPMPRGRPPGPRTASSSAKPVEKTRAWSGRAGRASGSGSSCAGSVARAPITSPATRGAAAPQRDRRVARAAVTSGERVAIRSLVSNIRSNESRLSGRSRSSTRRQPAR